MAKKTVAPAPTSGKKKGKKAPAVRETHESNGVGRAKKEGMRKAQVRILRALGKAGVPLSKLQICEKVAKEFPTAAKFTAWMTDPIGGADPEARKVAEEKNGYPSLLTLKYIRSLKSQSEEGDREVTVYEITALGKKTLQSLSNS